MHTYPYPCTGLIDIHGFGSYLESEIKEPRVLQMFERTLFVGIHQTISPDYMEEMGSILHECL